MALQQQVFLCLACVATSAEGTLTGACSFYGFVQFWVPDGMEEKRNQSSTIDSEELHLRQIHIYSQTVRLISFQIVLLKSVKFPPE